MRQHGRRRVATGLLVSMLALTSLVFSATSSAATNPYEPEECHSVVGSARVRTHQEGETVAEKVKNNLFTNIAAKQKLIFIWEHSENKFVLTKLTSATCTTSPTDKFKGTGVGTFNGEEGWTATFTLTLSSKHAFSARLTLKMKGETPITVKLNASKVSSETFS
ncbi:MAG: hypothetical protein ACYDHT_08630 [Solirubrobacteraceae bacterium]